MDAEVDGRTRRGRGLLVLAATAAVVAGAREWAFARNRRLHGAPDTPVMSPPR